MGIDPSYTKTGWAIIMVPDAQIGDYGTVEVEDNYRRGMEYIKYQQYQEMGDMIHEVVKRFGVRTIVVESMFIGIISQPMIRSVEARAVICSRLARYNLDILSAMTVKKHFFGKVPKVLKTQMIKKMVEIYGLGKINEHEADAIAVATAWYDANRDVVSLCKKGAALHAASSIKMLEKGNR